VLTHALNYQPTLLLLFQYGDQVFYPNHSQTNKVILEYQENHFRFFKIERDIPWEQKEMDHLREAGLVEEMGNYFVPAGMTGEGEPYQDRLYGLIEWLRQHAGQLEEAGFRINQKLENKTYSWNPFELESKIDEKNDWFDVKAMVKIGDYQIPFIKLKKYILQGIREIPLPNGRYAVLPEEWFATYADLFKFGKVEQDHLHIHKHHFKILQHSLHSFRHSYLERLENLNEELQTHEISVPRELLPTLRPYQLKGYGWMNLLQKHEFGGCLADDMGLGKTIQTLTLLLHVKQNTEKAELPVQEKEHTHQLSLFDQCSQEEPTTETMEQTAPVSLIVMPTSLIYNWENEIKKFTPQLSAYRFTGMNRTRQPQTLCRYDIALTTYGVVRNDYELLKQIPFHYIILDESQYIKNPSSKIYKAVNELQSRHKLVLTGTPIENSLADLWAQFNFLNKGLLGSYHFFKNEFIHPIEKQNNQDQEAKLQAIIDPFILRRTKNQVAPELPEKTEQVVYCEMTESQWSYYESEKSKIRNALIENLEEQEEQDNLKILDGLSRLRQIANHPRMIDEDYQEDSGKFREIIDYLESLISEDHKVLVFSSYKKHLRLLESHFNAIGWQYSLLTGETHNRQKVINEFQDQEENKIFLIQIKAGGFGLNLTAADYVLILDPWWNPAVEEQAINRAHRIGQEKKVMVYRFISAGTVEEKIRGLQRRKARLAQTFITPSDTLKKLTKEELMELFR
jgi:SNF2 family DNA or RNA helicase